MRKQGYSHDGFAQTHLIGQDAIQAACVDGHQPIQANVLVLPQGVLQQKGHLQQQRVCFLTPCTIHYVLKHLTCDVVDTTNLFITLPYSEVTHIDVCVRNIHTFIASVT